MHLQGRFSGFRGGPVAAAPLNIDLENISGRHAVLVACENAVLRANTVRAAGDRDRVLA